MPLSALIVDDEPPARRDLRRLLEAQPDVVVLADVATIDDARSALDRLAPDIVFLDLRLGNASGFELIPAVGAGTSIVVVTAYDQYALRAFDINAIDYLLKPVEPHRLAVALARVRGRASDPRRDQPDGRVALPDQLGVNDWLLLRDGGREEFVRTAAIVCVTAEGDYTRVGTSDGKSRLVHRSLREWEMRLPPGHFERVHRSALVNVRHVVSVERTLGYRSQLTLRGQPSLIVSRRRAAHLRRSRG